MKHVLSFSGGVGSWATGRRIIDAHGNTDLILLREGLGLVARELVAVIHALRGFADG